MTRRMLGPNYERLQDEFLRPLVERYNIVWRAGVLLILQVIAGQTGFAHLHRWRAQAEELQAMERYEQSLGMMMQFGHMEVGDNYDWDDRQGARPG